MLVSAWFASWRGGSRTDRLSAAGRKIVCGASQGTRTARTALIRTPDQHTRNWARRVKVKLAR
jgi:hypothetical protein